MNEKEKLAELIIQAIDTYATMPLVNGCRPELKYFTADYLLDNGVVAVDTEVVSPKNRPLISQCLGRPIDEVIELVHAKDEGRIIVPPCKVGDTVYEILPKAGYIRAVNVVGFHLGKFPTLRGHKRKEYFVGYLDQYLLHIRIDDIGKTVFLTRELAEEALNEQKKL